MWTLIFILLAVLTAILSLAIGFAFILIPYKRAIRVPKSYGYKNVDVYQYTSDDKEVLEVKPASSADGSNALKNFKQ